MTSPVTRITLAAGFEPEAVVVLSRDGKATVNVVSDPGSLAVVVPMRAGEVAAIVSMTAIGKYLDQGLPVVVAAERQGDAEQLSLLIGHRGTA